MPPAYSTYLATSDDSFTVVYSSSTDMCASKQISEAKSWHKVVYFTLNAGFSALPVLTLVAMNMFLVFFAMKKSNTAVHKRNIVIVVLVTASFILFGLPFFLYSVKYGEHTENHDPVLRFVTYIGFTSLWSNPVIYLVTNRSFRTFTVTRVTTRGRYNSTVFYNQTQQNIMIINRQQCYREGLMRIS
jgi:hypothetical protein